MLASFAEQKDLTTFVEDALTMVGAYVVNYGTGASEENHVFNVTDNEVLTLRPMLFGALTEQCETLKNMVSLSCKNPTLRTTCSSISYQTAKAFYPAIMVQVESTEFQKAIQLEFYDVSHMTKLEKLLLLKLLMPAKGESVENTDDSIRNFLDYIGYKGNGDEDKLFNNDNFVLANPTFCSTAIKFTPKHIIQVTNAETNEVKQTTNFADVAQLTEEDDNWKYRYLPVEPEFVGHLNMRGRLLKYIMPRIYDLKTTLAPQKLRQKPRKINGPVLISFHLMEGNLLIEYNYAGVSNTALLPQGTIEVFLMKKTQNDDLAKEDRLLELNRQFNLAIFPVIV